MRPIVILAVSIFVLWTLQPLSLLGAIQDKPQEPTAQEPSPPNAPDDKPQELKASEEPKTSEVTEKRLEAIEKLLEQLSGELKSKKQEDLFLRNTTKNSLFYQDNCLYAAQSKNIKN